MVKLRSYHVYMFVVLVERVQFKSFFFIKGLDPLTTTSMFASAWCIGKRWSGKIASYWIYVQTLRRWELVTRSLHKSSDMSSLGTSVRGLWSCSIEGMTTAHYVFSAVTLFRFIELVGCLERTKDVIMCLECICHRQSAYDDYKSKRQEKWTVWCNNLKGRNCKINKILLYLFLFTYYQLIYFWTSR
jgi:hypothetical protein